MKPLVLCITDKIGTLNIDNYSKVILNDKDINYAYLGLGKKVKLPQEIIKEELKNSNFDCNINLINAINYAKTAKSKIHIIGDITSDNENLNALIDVCKKLGVRKTYIHVFSSKKPNVDELKKKLSKGTLCNVIDSSLLNKDIDRVLDVLMKGKSNTISKNDLVIVYNNDVSFIEPLLDKMIESNIKLFTMFPYTDTYMYDYPLYDSLGECIFRSGLKALRCNINNYSFDGYKKVVYENEDIKVGNLLDIDISEYDFVIVKTNENLKKIKEYVDEKSGMLLILGKQNNKLCLFAPEKLDIKEGNVVNITATILNLLKIKKSSKMEKSLINKNTKICGFIFRVISLMFVISCITYYMARFLHFYLISR